MATASRAVLVRVVMLGRAKNFRHLTRGTTRLGSGWKQANGARRCLVPRPPLGAVLAATPEPAPSRPGLQRLEPVLDTRLVDGLRLIRGRLALLRMRGLGARVLPGLNHR